MTEREALKLAQKALSNRNAPPKTIYEALHAIKEALAQQDVRDEIDRGAKALRETYLAQRKPWVGLDADEVFELASGGWTLGQMAVLVEAKLKEKNT